MWWHLIKLLLWGVEELLSNRELCRAELCWGSVPAPSFSLRGLMGTCTQAGQSPGQAWAQVQLSYHICCFLNIYFILFFILSPNLLNFSETKRLSSLLCAWVGAACVGCGISGIRRFWKSWRNPICLRCGGVLLCLFCLLFFNHPEENGQVWIKIKL